MHQLPFTLRLSLLGSCCALILSGLALAGAALARDPELIAASAAVFLLMAAGAPLLIGRQIARSAREAKEASDDHSVFEEMTFGEARSFGDAPILEEAALSDDGTALRRTQKAKAIDRLRDGITHDLNNRLMVISANIDSVARQMKDQPSLQRKLLSALVASDQAAKLIAKSTAFARRSEVQVQFVDLAEHVSSVASLMSRSLLRDTVELRLSLEDGLWPVKADPDDIETAIVTLSAHIRDALTQGGTITIEAHNVQVQRGSLSNLTLEGEFVQLVIRSKGAGSMPRPQGSVGEEAFALRDIDLSSWFSLSQSLYFLRPLGGESEERKPQCKRQLMHGARLRIGLT